MTRSKQTFLLAPGIAGASTEPQGQKKAERLARARQDRAEKRMLKPINQV